MEALGMVFLGIITLMVLVAIIVFFIALPDMARYRRLRRM
jgi:hypothetical protein